MFSILNGYFIVSFLFFLRSRYYIVGDVIPRFPYIPKVLIGTNSRVRVYPVISFQSISRSDNLYLDFQLDA